MSVRSRILLCVASGIMLGACSGSNDEDSESGTTRAPRAGDHALPVDPATIACASGGTHCPDGHECLAIRDSRKACGPPAVPAVVLIRDRTLDGSCLAPPDDDPYPGASIISLGVVGVDGSIKGYGKLAWEQPGFTTATIRGTPPDGSAPSGDACAAAYNLGCDGQAVFQVLDSSGVAQPLREGDELVIHLRGASNCGEATVDEIEAAVCTEPAAALAGKLAGCTSRVRIVTLRSNLYGPDHVGGPFNSIRAK